MWQALGVVGMLWDTGFLLGFVLLTMRRWTLPAGALTLVIGLNAVAMGFLHRGAYPFLPVAGTGRGGSGGRGGVRLAAAVGAAPRRLAALCRRCPRPPHDAALWGARAHGGRVVVGALMGGDHRADGPGRSVSQPAARAPTLARQVTGRQIRTTLTGTTLAYASRARCARLESRSTWRSNAFDLSGEGTRWATPSLPGRGAESAPHRSHAEGGASCRKLVIASMLC